ncbi:MAG: 3-hydroxyacyl-CoA dehydrogenase NAD-binding domain-containing protein [Cytophagales bacterium]|nr:3-hydroxyacyl-CoA dehydrogenase NAD-binding domain-containing protein [Cytophagales bacterium]
MNRTIKKAAVLGSGVMGSRIACHFANIGLETILLDISPKSLTEDEQKLGLTLDNKLIKNKIVNAALDATLKANPAAIYKKSFASRIKTGNFDDDMHLIADCDWVIEAVVENLEIKKNVFEQVEKHRKTGTLISSNTSGIPINLMLEGRSDDFQKHFCGTHFFNPPRYLKLFEIIPTSKTDPSVIDFFVYYGDLFLGKTPVICKDTPAFIANRVGIYSIMNTLQATQTLSLTLEEVDKLTGPIIGRAKSATYRTADVVGLDTLAKVSENLYISCTNDEERDTFKLPEYLQKMISSKWLGDKTGQGFYKKTKTADGKTEILSLDLNTLEYVPQKKSKFATLELTKTVDDLRKRLTMLIQGQDNAGEFYKITYSGLFSYVSHRVPEIADEIYKIDEAIKAGFGWEIGPFETWDLFGVQTYADIMHKFGKKPASWVYEMISAGFTSFYKIENGKKLYYDIKTKRYTSIPGTEELIILDHIRDTNKIWGNSGCTLTDIGDGVANLEFHTKMNTLGGEVIEGINKSIEIAEKNHAGLVISNVGENFSAGANLALLLQYAVEQEWDDIHMMVSTFQKTMMRARYSSVPVVVAPHNMALGGGCEITLHADVVVAHAELYIGLVEFGVGLIPAGGGSKELTLRASDAYEKGDIEYNTLQNYYMGIAMAQVATSAYEALDHKILRPQDKIVISRARQLTEAKNEVLELSRAGYTKPIMRTDIKVQGKGGLAMFYTGASSMQRGAYISEHDMKISQKLAWIMCGGDLSYPQVVSEQYLLDLEREAFVSLCGEKKTLERIQSILTTGKPLRN